MRRSSTWLEWPGMSAPAESRDEMFRAGIDVLVNAVQACAFPGAVAAITIGGELVASEVVGRFTYESDSPQVTPHTIYDLASVSKVVATTTMAMLVYERGELDLDTPVCAVLPEFAAAEVAANDPRRREITLRMLLLHSSGLPGYERLFERARTCEDLVRAALALPLTADPGTRIEYSDVGFIVLGLALERLAGEPLDSFCQREIFGPLGMAHTCFRPPASCRVAIPPTEDDRAFRGRVIQGEVHDENAWVMGGIAGHAGVFSTANDVARFAAAILSGGHPILRPDTVELFTHAVEIGGTRHALGWDVPTPPSQAGRLFSPRSFGHLGFTGTSLWIDPERQLSVTLLTNRTWPDRKSDAIRTVRPAFHDAVVQAVDKHL